MRLNPFRRFRTFHGLEYLLAILVTMLFTLLLLPFRTEGGQDHTVLSLLYLLPVVLSSLLWGLGPGALVALASFLALNYFFVPPFYTLLVHRTQDLAGVDCFSRGFNYHRAISRKGEQKPG